MARSKKSAVAPAVGQWVLDQMEPDAPVMELASVEVEKKEQLAEEEVAPVPCEKKQLEVVAEEVEEVAVEAEEPPVPMGTGTSKGKSKGKGKGKGKGKSNKKLEDAATPPESPAGSEEEARLTGFDGILELIDAQKLNEAKAALKRLKRVAMKSAMVRRAMGLTDEDMAKKKRGPTPFNLFVRDQMKILTASNTSKLSNREMFRECSRLWNAQKQQQNDMVKSE
jgi:hypothetical protein